MKTLIKKSINGRKKNWLEICLQILLDTFPYGLDCEYYTSLKHTFAIFTLVKSLTFGTKKNPTKSTNDDYNNDAEIASDDHNEEFTYQEMLVRNAEKIC